MKKIILTGVALAVLCGCSKPIPPAPPANDQTQQQFQELNFRVWKLENQVSLLETNAEMDREAIGVMYAAQRQLITNVYYLHLAASNTIIYAHNGLQLNSSEIKSLRSGLNIVVDEMPNLASQAGAINLQHFTDEESANFYRSQNNALLQQQNDILEWQTLQTEQYQQTMEDAARRAYGP